MFDEKRTMIDEKSSSIHVSKSHINHWSDYLSSTPRFAGLMTTQKVKVLNDLSHLRLELLNRFIDVKIQAYVRFFVRFLCRQMSIIR